MKVVFLDIDGVLNCTESLRLVGKPRPFHRDSVAALNRILSETGAVIVVSSSWRYGQTLETLQEILRGEGVHPCLVVDKTQEYETQGLWSLGCLPRGKEIQNWIDAHPELTEYAILDDDNDVFVDTDPAHVVHTTFDRGLTDEHATRAIQILSTPIRSVANG